MPKIFATSPLLPAAVLFLLGVVVVPSFSSPLAPPLTALLLPLSITLSSLYLVTEFLGKTTLATLFLVLLLPTLGTLTYSLNQSYVQPNHIARFAPLNPNQESLIALRAQITSIPPDSQSHGNQFWLASASEIFTSQGWIPTTGTLLVQSPQSDQPLTSGISVELYGWLSRPPPSLNPGSINPQQKLAADRIFAQLRIPRTTGMIPLDTSAAQSPSLLTSARQFLRDKLLSHTLQQNVPAAYTLTALLLGTRDPAIADVSQNFADAGVAHLLAISGSHIVFFTGLVWFFLRFLPLRLRWREPIITAILALYVLATPCGPPIIRAAVALAMVLLARMLGRPRQYLNMLAAAAVVVILIRPADIADAGFQLSFITTLGLILFATPLHQLLFEKWLTRQTLFAELKATSFARWRLRSYRLLTGIFVANVIGALTAAPLVAYHFGQLNLYAPVAGIVALPAVSATMTLAALQLLAEFLHLGEFLSPLSALTGRGLIFLISDLAHLPGAAIALRQPPPWLILSFYAAMAVIPFRHRLHLSRAALVNLLVSLFLTSTLWYTFSAPTTTRLTILSVGDGSCILLQTPTGKTWLLNCGAQSSAAVTSALRPELRLQGIRQLDGILLAALDAPHARDAAVVTDTWIPRNILVPALWWQTRGQTAAGADLSAAVTRTNPHLFTLTQGDRIDLGGCQLEVLYPPNNGNPKSENLVLLLTQGPRRVLVMDPLMIDAVANLPLRCDTIIFTGAERGTADAPLRKTIATFGAQNIIWTHCGSWAGKSESPNNWNAQDGAVAVEISSTSLKVCLAIP